MCNYSVYAWKCRYLTPANNFSSNLKWQIWIFCPEQMEIQFFVFTYLRRNLWSKQIVKPNKRIFISWSDQDEYSTVNVFSRESKRDCSSMVVIPLIFLIPKKFFQKSNQKCPKAKEPLKQAFDEYICKKVEQWFCP